MDWELKQQKILVQTPPFSVEELQFNERASHLPLGHAYYRIVSPSWVNILALTPAQEVILVRQPRAGAMQMTLEIPGGNMDQGETPEAAAARELEEETGYRCDALQYLGSISPNPAIMSNKLHMFLARDCFIPEQRLRFQDAMERIEVLTRPLSEVERLLQAGEFQNALGALTLLMALRYAVDP